VTVGFPPTKNSVSFKDIFKRKRAKYKKPPPREAEVETYFKWRVARAGGKSYKWVSPGVRGVPDRIVIYKGDVFFVEIKTLKGKVSHHQKVVFEEIRKQGRCVFVVYGHRGVDDFLYSVLGK